MSLEDKLNELWDEPEFRGNVLKLFWVTSLGMVVMGYIIIIYLLFIG